MGFYNRNSGYIGYVNNSPLGNTKTNNVTSTTATTALLNVNNTPMYTDVSTNNQAITPVGFPSTSNNTPFGNGWSTLFDGTGDYLTVANNAMFNLGSSDFTIEAWIHPTTSGTVRQIISKNSGTYPTGYEWNFLLTASNTLQFGAYGTSLFSATSTVTIPTGVWTHVSAIRSASTVTIYVNGVASGTVAAQTIQTTTSTVMVGADSESGSGGRYFAGYVCSARVVKGTAVYTSNFIPSNALLAAVTNTSLLTCQSGMHVDGSSNNFQITPSGDVRTIVFSPLDRESFNISAASSSSVSTTAAISLATSTSPLTLEAWVKISGNTAGCIISDSYTGGGDAVSFVLGLNDGALNGSTVAGNKPWFGFYSGSTWSGNVLVSTTGIPFNEWVHIAGVFTGSTCRIYVNGKLIASGGPSTWTTVASNTVFIGRRWDTSSSAYFNGNIAEARISKELVYGGEFTPPTSPLTAGANTALLVACDGAIIDKSTNRYPMTVTGQVWQTKDTPYTYSPTVSFTGQSAFFNGSSCYATAVGSTAFTFGTGDFTVEYWIYPVALNSSYQQHVGIVTSANGLGFGANTSSGTIYATTLTVGYTTTAALTLNTWQHIAWVRSGTTLTAYKNGVSIGTFTVSTNFTDTGFGIGASPTGSYVTPQMYITNIRVVKGTAVYTSAFAPPPSALSAISGTSFLLSVNGRVVGDLTANNLPAVAFNNISNANKSPNTLVNNSVYFDGTGDYVAILSNPELTLGTADFTIEFWAYRVGTGDTALLDQRSLANGVYPHIYYSSASGALAYYVSSADRITGAYVPQYGWSHIAVCRINGVTRMYADGSQVGADYADTNNYLSNPVYLGVSAFTLNAAFLNGYMSGVRITKGIGLYTGSFIPDNSRTATVNARSSFVLDSSYKTIQDASSNGSVVYRATSNANVPDIFTPYWPNGQWSNYFDATNTCLLVNGTTSSGNIPTGTDFTIEFWLRSKSVNTGGGVVVGKSRFDSLSSDSWFMESNKGTGGNKLTFTGHNGTSIFTPVTSVTSVLDGNWHHCAVTRSGTTYRIFIDGVLEQQADDSTAINQGTTNITFCGIVYNTSNFAHQGNISNLRIVKGTCLYTSTFTPSTVPLTAVTNTLLLTAQSNRFIDNSSNNYSITVSNGTPLVKSDNPLITPTRANSAAYGGSLSMSGTEVVNLIGDYRPVGDFTVEGWFYVTSYASLRNIFTIGNETTSRISFLMAATTGTISYNVYGGSVISIGGAPTLNQWNHIAIVRSGTTITAYINGTSTGSVTLSGTLGNATNAAFGQPLGYLADQRYTNGRAIYTANFTPPTAMLPTTQTYASQISYYGSGMITNVEKQIDFEKNSVPGLAGKFFNGTDWRTPLPTGNVGTFPLSTTNDSSNVTLTGGLPSNAHRYGVNRYDYIYYLSVGDSYGFIAVGYFKPPVTGSYTFNTSSDDTSGMWIGNVAVLPTGRTSANAIVNNGLGVSAGQGNTKRSGTITLYQDTWYPVRVVHEEGSGGDNLYLTWSGPGIAETSDLSQYFRTPSNGTTLIGHYV